MLDKHDTGISGTLGMDIKHDCNAIDDDDASYLIYE